MIDFFKYTPGSLDAERQACEIVQGLYEARNH